MRQAWLPELALSTHVSLSLHDLGLSSPILLDLRVAGNSDRPAVWVSLRGQILRDISHTVLPNDRGLRSVLTSETLALDTVRLAGSYRCCQSLGRREPGSWDFDLLVCILGLRILTISCAAGESLPPIVSDKNGSSNCMLSNNLSRSSSLPPGTLLDLLETLWHLRQNSGHYRR